MECVHVHRGDGDTHLDNCVKCNIKLALEIFNSIHLPTVCVSSVVHTALNTLSPRTLTQWPQPHGSSHSSSSRTKQDVDITLYHFAFPIYVRAPTDPANFVSVEQGDSTALPPCTGRTFGLPTGLSSNYPAVRFGRRACALACATVTLPLVTEMRSSGGAIRCDAMRVAR